MAPRVLIIAGTDSSGGAGIAADLSALRAQGIAGVLAVTAVTAQDGAGVQGCWPVPAAGIIAQLRAAPPVDAVKIGMLGSAAAIHALRGWLQDFPGPVVIDPVLGASAGGGLLPSADRPALLGLIAGATLVTPNLPELTTLGGDRWLAGHPGAVLIKGGHGDGASLRDRLVGCGPERAWQHRRLPGTHRGTGCRLASAIAARLAWGDGLEDAVDAGIRWLQTVLAAQETGPGPSGSE